MDCPFCPMLTGEKPVMKIYEDEHTLVFLAGHGFEDGHMMAIPKKHVENVLDCDGETFSRLMLTVKKVANHLVNNCGYEGVNIFTAGGSAAQQTVMHLHVHIIPRKTGDGINAWPPFRGATADTAQMHEKLKMPE
ncbi:MAG: HIT family protein [Clostridiales bacterium]|nr:HIT family protein [Clostridiales bacterium]